MGIETDALNTCVIVATLTGRLHVSVRTGITDCFWLTLSAQFFDFHNTKHLFTISLPSGIVSTTLQRDNNLLACMCDDYAVRLVDVETRKVVRDFIGFRGRIVDIVIEREFLLSFTEQNEADDKHTHRPFLTIRAGC